MNPRWKISIALLSSVTLVALTVAWVWSFIWGDLNAQVISGIALLAWFYWIHFRLSDRIWPSTDGWRRWNFIVCVSCYVVIAISLPIAIVWSPL
jgi:hypothetical protein